MKIDAENVIFDIKDDNNNSMCLSLVNNAFKLVVGEQTFMSDSIENLDRLTSWNRITFTWQIQSNNSKFKIYLNSSLVKQVETSINYTLNNLLVSIGKKFEDDSTSFNGLMEMLVYETQDISNNLYALILKLNQKETINYTFDSLNMLISKSVKETEVLKNTYTYKIENEKQTQLVNKEDILMTNKTISNQYEYDSLGNVTLIKKNNETIHSYAYDELFRLKQATCYGDTFKYEYDVNGNITSIKDGNNNTLHTFTYSTTYKDMLIKYDNIDITYSNLACYNITGIGNNITLTYKAKDLETYSDSSKQIYERYYYNDKHLRVKKEILDSNGNVTSTITYTYDNNDNLIYQKQGNISLTFLYDNSNMLYGFIYNGYTYYYIRNILNDILGIVDIQGNKIVEYRYLDAWGNHSVFSRKVIHRSSISDSIIDGTIENVPNTDPSFIGNINPFRYKGYYYDKETGLFMMGQRYYNPEWGRFIQPDDIEYLDPQSINGLNLYAYCFNNPIMYIDSSGHFPVAIEAITTFVDGMMNLYEFGLKYSLKSLKNAPKITMDVAKKIARKGGHIQSARQIMRNQQKLIKSTQQSLDDVVKFGKKMGKVLLVADIAWSLGENIFSGEESWFTDTIVDASVSFAIYGLSLLPGGFFIALAATIATSIWEDEIEEFKDDFFEGWNNFWSFSWI